MTLKAALDTDFWKNHTIGDQYELKNRNGSIDIVKVTYYPLDNYEDFTAVVEMEKTRVVKHKREVEEIVRYNDFRETPIRFLKKVFAMA